MASNILYHSTDSQYLATELCNNVCRSTFVLSKHQKVDQIGGHEYTVFHNELQFRGLLHYYSVIATNQAKHLTVTQLDLGVGYKVAWLSLSY